MTSYENFLKLLDYPGRVYMEFEGELTNERRHETGEWLFGFTLFLDGVPTFYIEEYEMAYGIFSYGDGGTILDRCLGPHLPMVLRNLIVQEKRKHGA